MVSWNVVEEKTPSVVKLREPLIFIFLLECSQPLFKLSGPLSLVVEVVAETPAVCTRWVNVQGSHGLEWAKGLKIGDAVLKRIQEIVGTAGQECWRSVLGHVIHGGEAVEQNLEVGVKNLLKSSTF